MIGMMVNRGRSRGVRMPALVVILLLFSVVAPGLQAVSATAQDQPIPNLDAIDPARFKYSEAITAFKQVPARDGTTMLWLDYIRPNTTEKVPTIMVASPYFNDLGRGWKNELKNPHDATIAAADPTYAPGPRVPFPEWYAAYFVPRGYAIALLDLRGTRNSSACEVYGDRPEETDAVDTIDWIADQAWSNGKVGMIGGSYDGTLAVGTAAEQPISGRHKDALAAIVPVRAIDRWYDYHFYNGVQSSAHLATPEIFTTVEPLQDMPNSGTDDPLFAAHVAERKACIGTVGVTVDAQYLPPYENADSAFWQGRDFLKDVKGFRAAVFSLHGQFDYNVRTMNVGQLWNALPASVPKKFWFLNGDHFDPDIPTVKDATADGHLVPFPLPDKYHEGVHRWFLQFLKGVDAGALRTPKFEVQRDDGHFDAYDDYNVPAANQRDRVLSFTPTHNLVDGRAGGGSLTFDDGAGQAPASQVFLTEPFGRDTRLSGQIQFDLALSAAGPDTTVGVQVEDVPPGKENAQPATVYDGKNSGPLAFTFAWERLFYRDTIKPRGPSVPTGGAPLVPNQQYKVSFPSTYMDFIVHRGHRLRFTVADTAGPTLPADTGLIDTLYTGDGLSQLRLPLAPLVQQAAASSPTPSAAAPGAIVATRPQLPNTAAALPRVMGLQVFLLLLILPFTMVARWGRRSR
ncbi:MAG: CocE/NonD family hydrolase [Candidatus Dormibacteria bacterium]